MDIGVLMNFRSRLALRRDDREPRSMKPHLRHPTDLVRHAHSVLAWGVALSFVAGCNGGQPASSDTTSPDILGVETTEGACTDAPIGQVVACSAGFPLICDGAGDAVQGYCPPGDACQDRACAPLEGNVIVIMDTSGSMNYMPGRRFFANQCTEADCPPWTFPSCDDPDAPETRIGSAKVAIQRFVESPSADGFRIALQRFPSIPKGDDAPNCNAGYWASTAPELGLPSIVTGDTGARSTVEGGWLSQHLDEILVAPFASSGDRGSLLRWVDWREETEPSAIACLGDADCPESLCLEGLCHTTTNPELRAIGGTPLGKSLFYAGEIFRHRALIEGRTCTTDPDCASPHHSCIEGTCTDPLRRCRPNAIVVFTDGVESDNLQLDDFFHPRVQAKRLFVGLGCNSNSQCANSTLCESGRCRIPDEALPWARETSVCTSGEFSCENDAQCPNACRNTTVGDCASTCETSDVVFVTDDASDRLVGLDGAQLSIRVHIVDVSGRDDSNQLIAAFGGGSHKSVDAADPAAIANALNEVLRDLKSTTRCLSAP